MTITQHIQAQQANPYTVAKRWQRAASSGKVGRAWSIHLEPTADELAVVGLIGEVTRTTTKTEKTKTETVSMSLSAKDTTKTPAKDTTKTAMQLVALVFVMCLCAVVSLHNMAYISGEITGSLWVSYSITLLFTVAPFAMLYAGVSGVFGWAGTSLCIGLEVFCNATGIYRGLAGLKSSPLEIWATGSFIDSVSSMANLPHRTCALGISFAMAGMVAALFLISLYQIKK